MTNNTTATEANATSADNATQEQVEALWAEWNATADNMTAYLSARSNRTAEEVQNATNALNASGWEIMPAAPDASVFDLLEFGVEPFVMWLLPAIIMGMLLVSIMMDHTLASETDAGAAAEGHGAGAVGSTGSGDRWSSRCVTVVGKLAVKRAPSRHESRPARGQPLPVGSRGRRRMNGTCTEGVPTP